MKEYRIDRTFATMAGPEIVTSFFAELETAMAIYNAWDIGDKNLLGEELVGIRVYKVTYDNNKVVEELIEER